MGEKKWGKPYGRILPYNLGFKSYYRVIDELCISRKHGRTQILILLLDNKSSVGLIKGVELFDVKWAEIRLFHQLVVAGVGVVTHIMVYGINVFGDIDMLAQYLIGYPLQFSHVQITL